MAKKDTPKQNAIALVLANVESKIEDLQAVEIANAKADGILRDQAVIMRAEYGAGDTWDKRIISELSEGMQRIVAARLGDPRMGKTPVDRANFMSNYDMLNGVGKRERICEAGATDKGTFNEGVETDGGKTWLTRLYFARKVKNVASMYIHRIRKHATDKEERGPRTPEQRMVESKKRLIRDITTFRKNGVFSKETLEAIVAAVKALDVIDTMIAENNSNSIE